MTQKITINSGDSYRGYAETVLVRSGRGFRIIRSNHTRTQQESIKRQLRSGVTDTLSIETRTGSGDYIDGRIRNA